MEAEVKAAVIKFPASNCERDLVFVLSHAFNLNAQIIWHTQENLAQDITHIFLPGGFSYGDYLRAGILASVAPVMKEIIKRAQMGVRVMGICNGFQILCESKLLPGVLLKNYAGKFICKNISLNLNKKNISLPIAHNHGRYFATPKQLGKIQENNQVWLRYENNINGSCLNIAGLIDGPKRNIFGLMPHPERAISPWGQGNDGHEILKKFLFDAE